MVLCTYVNVQVLSIMLCVLLMPFVLLTLLPTSTSQDNIPMGVYVSESDDDSLETSVILAVDDINGQAINPVIFDVLTSTLNSANNDFVISMKACDLLSKGATVLLSSTTCQKSLHTHSIAAFHHVPMVYLGQETCCPELGSTSIESQETNTNTSETNPPPYKYWLTTYLTPSSVGLVIRDLVVKHSSSEPYWKDTVIFYDREHETAKRQIVESLGGLTLQSTEFEVNERVATETMLMEYRYILQHRDYFVVICGQQTLTWLLKEMRLSDLDLLGPKYMWVLVNDGTLDISGIESLLKEGDNVAIVNPYKYTEEEVDQVVKNVVNGIAEVYTDIWNAGDWTAQSTNCSTDNSWSIGSHVYQVLSEKLNSLQSNENTTEYEIITWTIGAAGKMVFADVAKWNRETRLTMYDHLFPELHHGFNNRTFVITTLPYTPFVIDYKNGTYGGICFDLLHELQRVLNFSYVIAKPTERVWGIEYKEGQLSGLLGMLQNKTVDFVVGPVAISEDRQKYVDYAQPYWVDPNIILVQKPDLASSNIFLCFGPFSDEVWLLICLSVIVAGLITWILTWLNPTRGEVNRKELGIYDLQINLWQSFGALMQQGMVYIPESHSARIMIACWWFYTIIVVGTYNGNLIAFLTAPKVNVPVNSLEELEDKELTFNIANQTVLHGIFLSALTGTMKTLGDRLRSDPEKYLVDMPDQGMARVYRDRRYAFLVEQSYYDTLASKTNMSFANLSCEFARAEQPFFMSMYAFPFQKNSPYIKQFSLAVLQILEAGLMDRWKSKWYPVGSKCTGLERTTSQTNISLAQAQGAFYILGIGLVMASLCLLTERILKLRKSRMKAAARKNSKDSRMTYVGPMARRAPSHRNGAQTTSMFHNPQFVSPFEVTNGNMYTYTEPASDKPSTSGEKSQRNKKRKKSNSCPLLFECCRRVKKEDYTMRNGFVNGAVNLRSAFSDTLWIGRKDNVQQNGKHSNGVVTQNGVNSYSKSQSYSGFTFESIRKNKKTIHTNKDAETGEISNDAAFFSIRL